MPWKSIRWSELSEPLHSRLFSPVSAVPAVSAGRLCAVCWKFRCFTSEKQHELGNQRDPESYPLCKKTDPNLNECINKATQVVLPQLRDGIPSLNVPSIDPLQVTTINIGQGHGPISINMKFSDITVRGLSDAEAHKANVDLKNYAMNFTGSIKNVSFVSQYEMTGRILLLPVTGKGPCKLTFTNIQAILGPRGKGIMKKGKNYYDVTDFYLDIYGLDKLQVQFDNLFNGDKTLGNSMNTLLNENWKDLWSEMKPAFDEVFGAVFHQYAKGVFSGVAFDDIFLD